MELQIRNLSKSYANGVQALKNITLTIPQGMFGLLGPNGAGKSTLMRIIATLQEPDEGSIHFGNPSTGSGQAIDVVSPEGPRPRTLGYPAAEFGVYPKVTADISGHFAILKGITTGGRAAHRRRAPPADESVGSPERRAQRLLRRHAAALRHRRRAARKPEADHRRRAHRRPRSRRARALLNLLSEIGEDAVVILSTHIVDDVLELCSRVAIINKGTILLEAEPLQAVAAMQGRIWRRVIDKAELPGLELAQTVISTKLVAGRTVVRVHSRTLPATGFEAVEPDLEDVYFSAMAGHCAPGEPTVQAVR